MKQTYILHPFLFALFPVLALYSRNQDMAQFSYMLKPAILSFALAIFLFSVLKFFIKNLIKTAIITSLFLALFFSFGHFLSLIPSITVNNLIIYNYFFVAIVWLILLVFPSLLTLSTKKKLNVLTVYLNIFSVILIVLPLLNILIYKITTEEIAASFNAPTAPLEINKPQSLPDIYYIILDGYARADVLKDIYGYDNSEFIQWLTDNQFYVAHKSAANYPQTYLSLSSSLNLEYINYLSEAVGSDSDDRQPLKRLLKNNQVYDILKSFDYKFVAAPSTWSGACDNLKADIKMPYKMGLNEFDNIFINTTPLSLVLGKQIMLDFYRKKLLYTFDHLASIAELDAPTFTYVHFLLPHPPFVFNREGGAINPEKTFSGLDGSHYFEIYPDVNEYRSKYSNQVNFVNKKAKTMIKEILDRSPRPPIIIIQADHGPGSGTDWENPQATDMRERLSILNAYYLPDACQDSLYDTITPVNSFRVVFNCILGTDYEILPDNNYFSIWEQPYNFIDVTSEL